MQAKLGIGLGTQPGYCRTWMTGVTRHSSLVAVRTSLLAQFSAGRSTIISQTNTIHFMMMMDSATRRYGRHTDRMKRFELGVLAYILYLSENHSLTIEQFAESFAIPNDGEFLLRGTWICYLKRNWIRNGFELNGIRFSDCAKIWRNLVLVSKIITWLLDRTGIIMGLYILIGEW